jgi:excisionase family DNA binding protein
MAQGYYTLTEAARLLGVTEDELKLIARRGDIRSFQDRGTWRFRLQDIHELARQRGLGSEPDVPLGDAGAPATKPPPGFDESSEENKVFGFMTDDSSSEETEAIDIGREELPSGQSGKSSSSVGLGQSKTPQPGPPRFRPWARAITAIRLHRTATPAW